MLLGKWKSTRRALSGEKVPNEILTAISSKYSGYKLKKYILLQLEVVKRRNL